MESDFIQVGRIELNSAKVVPSDLEISLLAAFMRLMKPDFEKAHQRRIQGIDPEHRLVGIVDMFMPGPVRIGQEVTFLHIESLAFDDTLRAFAFDDEAHAGLSVAMRDRMLSGLKHLDIELEGVRRRSFVGTAQPDDSPRNHFQADHLARLSDGVLECPSTSTGTAYRLEAGWR